MLNIFYVYIYFRPWNGQPCYVGKGKRNRWNYHLCLGVNHPNKHFANIFLKANGRELPRVKIREHLSEEEALEMEVALIRAIGRQINGGPLVNLTDGGEGVVNMPFESRQRISEAMKVRVAGSKNPFFGKRHSDDTKRAISLKNSGKRGPMKDLKGAKHPWFGRKHTEATRLKMSIVQKDRIVSEETKKKISEIVSKRMVDPDIKARHLAAQKRRRDREREEKQCSL